MRSVGGSTVPSLSSAAVTLLGLRVTRMQILRISALLTLRTLAHLVHIPLDEGVQTYLWTFLFSSAQAGVALAAAASFFHPGGMLGSIVDRVLPRAADGAFLALFARVVSLAGPLCLCVEAAVVVYETMRVARLAERAMFRAERDGSRVARPALLLLSTVALFSACGLAALVWHAGGMQLASVSVAAIVLVAALAVGSAEGNVVEGSFVALYVSLVWLLGIVEEMSLDSPLLGVVWRRDLMSRIATDEAKAVVLVVSLVLLFAGMSRAEWFAHVVMLGHDGALNADAVGGEGSKEDKDEDQDDVAQQQRRQQMQADVGSSKTMRTLISALSLLGATFRVLLWAGQLDKGEYLPIPCRGWQVLITVLLYGVFVRM